jgi:hypothetical protein
MLQLRAQIMAYRILARNQPLPPQIAMAVQVPIYTEDFFYIKSKKKKLLNICLTVLVINVGAKF